MRRPAPLLIALALAAAVFPSHAGAQTAAPTPERLDPHSAKACIHCHPPLSPGQTQRPDGPSLITSADPNHKQMATICQTCHKDRSFDFWIFIFPKGAPPPAAGPVKPVPSPTAAPTPAPVSNLNPLQAKIAQALASKKTKVTYAGQRSSGLELERRTSKVASEGAGPSVDPHKDLACQQCHRTRPIRGIDTLASVELLNQDFDDLSLCGGCHERENIHPTGIAVQEKPGLKVPPANLPLAPKGSHKGQVVCITCHDVHPTGDHVALLRGIPAQYPSRKEFCEACHTSWSSFASPHKGNEHSCPLCHSSDPLASAQITLRVDPLSLCNFCHPKTGQAHYLRFNPFADPTLATVLASTGLPGVPDSISCNTCHEPHGISPYDQLLREGFVSLSNRSVRIYPHGKKAFCGSCHRGDPSSDPSTLRENGDPIAMCNRCHASGQVTGEIHPVGVRSSERTWKMDFVGWPLEKGMLTCITCHQHSGEGEAKVKNTTFLRGGPYPSRDEFCLKCHDEASFKEINPHQQMTEEGDLIPKSCLACHSSIPDPAAKNLTDVSFRMDLNALCRQCHNVLEHPAGVDHLQVPSDSIRTRMEEYQEKYDVVYPLDRDGRITCNTCHNPHQSGVVKGKFDLGADESNRQRLPTWKGMLCAPCHGGGGLK